MRGKTGKADPSDERGDRSPADWNGHGVSRGVSPKKKQLAAYLRENPGVNNKSYIARELGIDRTTVQKYYDEVRAELAAPAAQ